MVPALKHFKCYLCGQKITVWMDDSAVSWLHRSKDPVGQPTRWIEVIGTRADSASQRGAGSDKESEM